MMNYLLVFISSGIGTAIVGFFLNKLSLRDQNKAGGEMVLSSKITEALLDVQKFERQLRTIELVNLDKIDDAFGEDSKWIPAIFFKKENLFAFQNQLGDIIRENERFLDMRTIALLMAMERYLGKLILSFKGQSEEDLKLLGYLISSDVEKWQKDLDTHLIKRINKFSSKLTTLSGNKWNRIRSKTIKKYVEDSELMRQIEAQ